jgi:hypothetical protein
MKIERKIYRDGNLCPEVFNYLKSLPDNILFHSAYTERHPFSIYARSMERILKAFSAVLSEVEIISITLFDNIEKPKYSLEKLPELQKELLSSLQSHIDDCYRIMKVLHPPESSKDCFFVESWLEKAKHPTYKDFRTNVKDYKDSFFPIVNKIKHNGGEIRPIIMYSKGDNIVVKEPNNGIKYLPKNIVILGYFLEGVLPSGGIGPDYEIHNGGKTAISLNRDLRFHFANVYRISLHLKRAIVRAVRLTHGIDLPYPGFIEPNPFFQKIEEIAEQISNLSPFFFQNELYQKIPKIFYNKENKGSVLEFEFPGSKNIIWRGSMNIQVSVQMDFFSGSYKLPYLGKE